LGKNPSSLNVEQQESDHLEKKKEDWNYLKQTFRSGQNMFKQAASQGGANNNNNGGAKVADPKKNNVDNQ
jgi:hypothetical protein